MSLCLQSSQSLDDADYVDSFLELVARAPSPKKVPHLPRADDQVCGKYRIVRRIGSGGMGAVFEAVHGLTGQHVALKWLMPHAAIEKRHIERFVREARATARVRTRTSATFTTLAGTMAPSSSR